MKFTADQASFSHALSNARRALAQKTAPMNGLLLRTDGSELEITGTDADTTITARIGVTVSERGAQVLNGRLLADIVRAMGPGRVEVQINDDGARLRHGRSSFDLLCMAIEDFPTISHASGPSVSLDPGILADALHQVVPSASADAMRQVLTGVLIEATDAGVRLVATDSYRLAIRDVDAIRLPEGIASALVPAHALAEVMRLLGSGEQTEVIFDERRVSFRVGDVTLTTRLIEGEFPNYHSLIPESSPNKLTVGRESLSGSLRRIKPVVDDGPVRLVLDPAGSRVEVATPDRGRATEDLDAAYAGEPLTIAFNPDFLAAGLDALDGETAVLEFRDSLKPAIMRSTFDFTYLLMPVRISS